MELRSRYEGCEIVIPQTELLYCAHPEAAEMHLVSRGVLRSLRFWEEHPEPPVVTLSAILVDLSCPLSEVYSLAHMVVLETMWCLPGFLCVSSAGAVPR